MLKQHDDAESAALRGKGASGCAVVRKPMPDGAKALRNGGGMTMVCMKMLRRLVDHWVAMVTLVWGLH